MCEFKYCRGTGTCFLSKTSPCSGFAAETGETAPKKDRPRSVRMSYAGFLDHEELMDVLEAEDPVEEKSGFGSFVSAAPRFLRRAQEAFQSDKSKVA